MSKVSEQLRGLVNAYDRGAYAYATVLDPTLELTACHTSEIAGISAGDRVLDLATGTGAIARASARSGAEVAGLDLSRNMLAIAQRLSPRSISFVLADASFLPFGSRVFDTVTCGLSMSHFSDVPAVLAEVRRSLRPLGVFVASTWGSTGSDPSFSVVLSIYRKYTHNKPRPYSFFLDETSWMDPNRGTEAILGSGLVSVEVITRRLTGVYGSPAAAVQWALAWPLTADGCNQLDSVTSDALWTDAVAAVEAIQNLEWNRDVHYYRARSPA